MIAKKKTYRMIGLFLNLSKQYSTFSYLIFHYMKEQVHRITD